jgi:hypothetical protein
MYMSLQHCPAACTDTAVDRKPVRYNIALMTATPATTHQPADILRLAPVTQAANGICYASSGEITVSSDELERMVTAVPYAIAASLQRKAFYFVPLTIVQGEDVTIADRYDVALSDQAVCHRNLNLGDAQCVFISTRLMEDKFAVGFEFFINVGHAFVDQAGVAQGFTDIALKQLVDKVRGETSLDAYELRKIGSSGGPDSEKAKNEFLQAAFADAIAIYMLSLYVDVDYNELRERDYPLLAPTALAERLRKVAELFPAPAGYEFAVYHRRRT